MEQQQQLEVAERVISHIMEKYQIDREFAVCGGFHDKMRYDATDIMYRLGISSEIVHSFMYEFYEG